MKKMKIIFIDFDDVRNPLLGAGQAKATLEVGSRLAQRGHEINVYCSKYPRYKNRVENGIKYNHIGVGTKNIRLNNFIYIFCVPFAVMNMKADVIIECFTAPISTLFTPLFTKIPVIALTTSFEASRFAQIYHLPFDKVERFGLRFYKYGIALTEFFAEKIKSVSINAEVVVIGEGVGKEFFKIKRSKNLEHILFLGRLDMSQKGIDLLLEAYKLVSKKIKYPLVIAGNGPDEEKIKNKIIDLGLSNRVSMVGPAWGEKKNNLLSKSVICAFSSRNETFSLFALEAMASGIGLVAFDIPGLKWNDGVALKSKPFNIKDYANNLLVVNDASRVDELSINSRQFARKFTWDQVANDFNKFIYHVNKLNTK